MQDRSIQSTPRQAQLKRFFTVPQVADTLEQSVQTVWRKVASGELESHVFGRSRRISAEALQDYIDRCSSPAVR